MVELIDGQYEVDGLLLGEGTPYVVREFEDGGLPERITQDSPQSYDDGIVFGADRFGGMLHVFDVLAETAGGGAAFDAAQAARRVWRGDAVRRSPGAVQVLRVKRPGAPTRRVYGRTGRFTPVMSRNSGVGLVPYVADFRGADDRWYDDEPVSEVLGIVPPTTSGFTFPAVFPMTSAEVTERPGILNHPGDVDTWPVLTIAGPVTNPALELRVDGARVWLFEVAASLAAGQVLTVDTRPWVRTLLRQDGANMSGERTRATSPIADIKIPPGLSTILFRGSDISGTAQASVTFEPAYAAR
jgi:hypothetical protein